MDADTAADPRFKPVRFLLVYAGVTLAFFSASGSKLAPYILPMLPVLAALAGISAPRPAGIRAARRPQRRRAGRGVVAPDCSSTACVATATCRTPPCMGRSGHAHRARGGALRRRAPAADAGAGALVTALAGVLAWQFLLCEYGAIPPARSARELADSVRSLITPQTPLYSVGQYRQTLAPYLGRTLQLAGFEGELQFGLTEQPELRMSVEQFAARWSAGGDAVAFFDLDCGMSGGGGACRAA